MLIDILRWTATATGIVAAVLIALNAGPRVTGIGFIIFTACSLCWAGVGLMDEEETGLAIQNVVLTGVNLLGIYRYLIAKPAQIGSFKGLEKAD